MNSVVGRIRVGLVGAALAGAMLAGCKEQGTATGSGESVTKPARYVFGVIAKSESNPVFQAARTGAQEAGEELDGRDGVSVEVIWRTPTDEDAQKQAEYIAQLVSQGVDGIAVSCTDASVLTGAINDAVDAGVEVVTFDSDAPESKRFAYYGINDVEAGRAVMRALAEEMGGSGVVAVLGGNATAPNLQARIQGVKEAAEDYADIEVAHTFYHAETAPDAAAKVQLEQQNHPEITGWAMVGGWPLFTSNALDGVYQQAKVVSVDHLPEQLAYVRAGQVQALIGQDCYGWGHESVMLLFDKVHNQKSPESVVNNFELSVVDGDNVEEYAGVWEAWLGD